MEIAALIISIIGLFFNPLAIPSILSLILAWEWNQDTKGKFAIAVAAITLSILEIVVFGIGVLGLILRG